ncbi:putative transporter ESBP6 [Candida viswanathii]|uniref:Putative transporter ESBP6 n=1 Tax=Candida viswanathii TaxID=5486 RepID=A0A367YGL2_9ASCO|nr:putative transporter ESBP6 [Candida viswanathii]
MTNKTSLEEYSPSSKKSISDDSHHSTEDDQDIIPYQIQQITSATSSSASSAHHSIARTRSNQSDLSRIISGIRDDQQLDDVTKYNTFGESDFILANQLDRVGTNVIQNSQRNSIGDIELQTGIVGAGAGVVGVTDGPGKSSSRSSVNQSPEEQEDEKAEVEDKVHKPDSGLAWVMAFCAMMSMFATWGANAGFGVFLNFYLNSGTFPGATSYDFALIGGIIVCLANLLSPISALMYKVFGFQIVCFIGVIVQTAGWILASYATKLWHLYLTQGVLVGISFLLIFIPATLILPTWFVKQKATSMGICVAGAGLGGLIFSLSVNKVIQDTGDQKWALRMVGIVCLFAALVSAVIMKPRNVKQPPLKSTMTKQFVIESFKAIFDPKVFRIPGICIIAVWFALALMGYTLMLFSLSSYASSVGLTHSQASVLTAVMNAAQIIGRPSMGLTADRFGRANFTASASLVISILLFAFWINARSYAALIAFACIIGLIIGVGSSLAQPLAADVIHPHLDKMPAAWSGINIFVSPFCLVSEVIALALVVLNSSRPYLHTQIFAGCCFFACFLIMMTLREYLIRKFLKERLEIMQNKLNNISGTTKSGYLKAEARVETDSDEGDNKLEAEDEYLLKERVERYNYLLRGSIKDYFVRMLYPIKI